MHRFNEDHCTRRPPHELLDSKIYSLVRGILGNISRYSYYEQ